MKLLLYAVLALGLALGLTSCESAGGASAAQKVAVACASASASLKVLTIANDAGKLTPEQQRKISAAGHTIEPICGADEPPALDTLRFQAFTAAVDALAVAAAAGERP